MTSDTMRWYVLDPKGKTVTDVIVAGPYTEFEKLCDEYGYHKGSIYDGDEYEAALLDSTKVTRHLEMDKALVDWFANRGRNPLQ